MGTPVRPAFTRRQILSSAAGLGALAIAHHGTLPRAAAFRAPLTAERSFRLARADDDSPIASLLTRVQRFGDEAAAIDAVTAVIANPLDLPDGEHHEISVSATELEAPADLPSGAVLTMLALSTIAGAAAFEQRHVLAVVRRTSFVWRHFASGQDADLLFEEAFAVASATSSREIGTFNVTMGAAGLYEGGLWDLLPVPRDVPAGLSVVEDKPADG